MELIHIDPRYFRPTEVEFLLGDPSKARDKLGWQANTPFEEMVRMMVRKDIQEAEKDQLCKREGFRTYQQQFE
jgi:GDPmannose 4,6-dehydratase